MTTRHPKSSAFRAVEKQCAWCDAPLALRNTRDIERKRFCSHACCQRWRYRQEGWDMTKMRSAITLEARMAGMKAALHARICEHCGAAYTPTSVRQRWCQTCCPSKGARERMRRYGISHEQYEEMVKRQAGRCPICATMPIKFMVDHDHRTGVVRGLLCTTCNAHLHTIENHLQAALRYLGVPG
jgi:hypothetical protein